MCKKGQFFSQSINSQWMNDECKSKFLVKKAIFCHFFVKKVNQSMMKVTFLSKKGIINQSNNQWMNWMNELIEWMNEWMNWLIDSKCQFLSKFVIFLLKKINQTIIN